MKILSILKDIATFGLKAATNPAVDSIVSMVNPAAGGILSAIAKVAAAVEQKSVSAPAPMSSAAKKSEFQSMISTAIQLELGSAATPAMLAAASPAIDSFIALVNNVALMAEQATAGIAPTAEFGIPALTQGAPKA